MRLAPTLPVFATTTPGDELRRFQHRYAPSVALAYNIPDPICQIINSPVRNKKGARNSPVRPRPKPRLKKYEVPIIRFWSDVSSSVPLITPILLSPETLLTSSVSLKLAVNGNRSLSNPKLDTEKDRPLCPVEVGRPCSSRAVNESSESWEDLECNDDRSCSGNS